MGNLASGDEAFVSTFFYFLVLPLVFILLVSENQGRDRDSTSTGEGVGVTSGVVKKAGLGKLADRMEVKLRRSFRYLCAALQERGNTMWMEVKFRRSFCYQ